jgi:hypothetical protein
MELTATLTASGPPLDTAHQPPAGDRISFTHGKTMGVTEKLLPPGKSHHFFLSHKKTHSLFGGVPEQVAKNLHDSLELCGYGGWFDIDNLKRITREDIRGAIETCCAMIIVLHDETLDSEWCRYEWQCANELGVPCKVVIDMERASKAALLSKCTASFPTLLNFQWLEFTEGHRRDCLFEVCDFLESFALGSAPEVEDTDSYVLTFGQNKIQVVPPLLQKLLMYSGAPLRPPKTAAGKVYKGFLDFMRFGCLLVCGARLFYTRGPVYTERHSCFIFVLLHVLLLSLPPVINRVLFSTTFREMLRGMEGNSGEEVAKRTYKELNLYTFFVLGQLVSNGFLAFYGYLPLFFHSFYTGPDANTDDAIFGYFSGSWFAIAIPVLSMQAGASLVLLYLVLVVVFHQFEAAFDVLDPKVSQLGLKNYVRTACNSRANITRRRRLSESSVSQAPNKDGSPTHLHMRVTAESLALFHEKWIDATRNQEEVLVRLKPIIIVSWLLWLSGIFLPSTIVYARARREACTLRRDGVRRGGHLPAPRRHARQADYRRAGRRRGPRPADRPRRRRRPGGPSQVRPLPAVAARQCGPGPPLTLPPPPPTPPSPTCGSLSPSDPPLP